MPSGDTVQPDFVFLSEANLERTPTLDPEKFGRIVPDLVVEILSPSTAKRDRTEKKRIYEKNGVSEYWIVDRRKRRVTVFRLDGADYGPALKVVRGSIDSSALPGFSIALETLFADCD